jgi:hypothetical protein
MFDDAFRARRDRATLQGRCAARLAGLAIAVAIAVAAAAPVNAETIAVFVDRAKVVKLPDKTSTVIVGNPIIADVSVQKNGILVVTGKSFGMTNLISLDSEGSILNESMIRVEATSESVVTVQRGMDRESYSCTPQCMPAIKLGDDPKYFEAVGGQAGKRSALATQR